MISSRYAVIVLLLLGLALVPTVIHSYYGLLDQDGLATDAINPNLAGFHSSPTARKARWVKEMFDSEDWIERNYVSRQGESARLFAARSYDHKRLYHHPELAILYGMDFKDEGIYRLPGSPEVPVRLLTKRTGKGAAAYTLLYDDEFVSNPIGFQLKTSFELVFSPRKPLTLLLVFDKDLPSHHALEDSPAARVLLDAVESFRNQRTGDIASSL